MTGGNTHSSRPASHWLAGVTTPADLASVLRKLRRRDARQRGAREWTYRELAAMTGWSHATIGEYLTGRTVPPTDRFDTLVQLLGATAEELGPLATVRDRVDESRSQARLAGYPRAGLVVPRQLPAAVRHTVATGYCCCWTTRSPSGRSCSLASSSARW